MKRSQTYTPFAKRLVIGLFVIAFLERVIFDLGANVELVTAAFILGSAYLGRNQVLWLVLVLMVSTDLLLGNTNIFLFTWSGFLVPAFFAGGLTKKLMRFIKHSKVRFPNKLLKGIALTSLGLTSNLFFFFWTNFGVWLLDSYGMYANDFEGLMLCLINGLPFLRSQILSTLIFIPVFAIAVEISTLPVFKLLTNKLLFSNNFKVLVKN